MAVDTTSALESQPLLSNEAATTMVAAPPGYIEVIPHHVTSRPGQMSFVVNIPEKTDTVAHSSVLMVTVQSPASCNHASDVVILGLNDRQWDVVVIMLLTMLCVILYFK